MLQAGVNHVFRGVRLVGLWNQAAALGELLLNWRGQVRKRADRKTADPVVKGMSGNDDLTAFIELGGLLSGDKWDGANEHAEQTTALR